MEKRYKVGLFFILALIMALLVVLMWKRHTMDGFPREGGGVSQDKDGDSPDEKSEKTAEEIYQVQKMNVTTTSDTICIYEDIDKKDGSMHMMEIRLPEQYVGLNREGLEDILAEGNLFPAPEEKEKGFKSQHLELFSADRIKILRIYDTSTKLSGFYIMDVGGEVRVYECDKTTLYFKTGLRVENLPPDVRYELREGKYMDTELQVYHFIESYSS